MKKIFLLILSIVAAFSFSGCGGETDNFKDIKAFVPDGAPALAFAKLLSENTPFEGLNITYEIVSGAELLKAKVVSGEADIAVMPANLAAAVYNGGIPVKMLSVNTHGNLYMVGSEEINDLNLLKGKIVYNIGEGGTPDKTFRYILEKKGIEYERSDMPITGKVALNYVSAASELIPLLKTGKAEYGIMGEPAVTQSLNVINGDGDSANDVVLSLDLQKEWQNITENAGYPQAVIVAKAALTEKLPDFIAKFLNAVDENTEWVSNNAEAAKAALTAYGSKMTVIDSAVIGRCNIRLVKASDAKQSVANYLAAINVKQPDDNFYYTNA